MGDLGSLSRPPRKTSTGARILADGTGIVANYQFYFRLEEASWPAIAKVVDVVLDALNEADDWTKDNIEAVAEQLSPSVGLPASGAGGVARSGRLTESCRSATT